MKLYSTLFFLAFAFAVQAQEILKRDAAIDIVLEKHYDILVAKNSIEQAENNADILNSGYLPTLSTSGNANVSYNQGENKTVQGVSTFDPAESYTYGAAVNLNYTVFNGSRRYNFKQLKEQRNLTELQARQVIEQTILSFSSAYFELARLEEVSATQKEAMSISADRLKRAEYNYQYGQSTQLDVLNAEVDFNNDSISFMNSRQQLINAKRNINLMLARDLETDFKVETDVTFSLAQKKGELLENALERNVQIEQSNSQLSNNEWALKKSQSGWLPQLSFNAAYNYNGSDNPNGAFLVGNYSQGPQAGFTLSWNLFDGGSTSTQVKNARLAIDAQHIKQQQTEANVSRNVLNALTVYENALFVLEAQKTNLATNQRNFDRSEEMYKQGQINSITFRQAQLNMLSSKNQYTTAKYDAKNAELQLKQLAGILLD
jgi:outer membrane protein TolC